MSTAVYTWKSEDNLQKLVLSSYHMGSRGLAQVHQAGGERAPLRTKTSHQPNFYVLYQAILNQVTTKISYLLGSLTM